MSNFFQELKRRHVVKAGLAYLVGAWLLVQVLSIVLPAFGLGQGWMKTTLVILSIGFPIWLILAWVYDFSWGSIEKTEDVPFDPEVSRKKNIGLNRFIIGGLAIAVILLLVNTLRLSSKVDVMEEQLLPMEFANSLAILPFDDLSPKQDQRYFTDGLARSIYDRLARSKDLKLISPTSSLQYRDKDVSIEVIADELGVRYVLEGSVLLFGDQYRASINLVDTRDGSTIWSKTFQDNLENVLGTYDEVSANVGSYLNITLSSEDVRKRKVDPEAYLLYLKAEDTLLYFDRVSTLAADSLIRRSISIDPNYSESQVSLSKMTLHKGLYLEYYSYEESIKIGMNAAREAIRLDSTSIEGHNWMSNWKWHDRDVEASMRYLDKAYELGGSNNANTTEYTAFQAMRMNNLKKAYQLIKKALELDPLNRDMYMFKYWLDIYYSNYEEALRTLNKFVELDKATESHHDMEAMIYRYNGKLDKALEIVEKEENRYWHLNAKSPILYDMGKIEDANKLINEIREIPIDSVPDDTVPEFELAVIYAHRGDNDKAFDYLNKSFGINCLYPEWLFFQKDFKNLYGDPRWDAYIDRLSEEFNYDFPHRPE
ncbi:MAG: hypothetical protein HKP08_07155 [Flavobacteriaceae bacterium]|nr:hypothetical protein [Flavobacteriaceae bacterium]